MLDGSCVRWVEQVSGMGSGVTAAFQCFNRRISHRLEPEMVCIIYDRMMMTGNSVDEA
jgi:hypothetical protein